MRDLLLVGAGGFVGAVLRYGVSRALPRDGGVPWATLVVNVAGCLAIGLLLAWVERGRLSEDARLALVVGILGALTTFSTFGYETVALARAGSLGLAAASVAANVALGIGAVLLGLRLAG